MSFRELTMIDVREVLRRMQAGQSARQLARDGVVDRKTALRYFEAARACGVGPETPLDDGLVAEVASRVQIRPEAPTRIEGWLRAERRFAHHELGWRERTPTVRGNPLHVRLAVAGANPRRALRGSGFRAT